MDNDIVPGLLEAIERDFDQMTYDSPKLKRALRQLQANKASYLDVNAYAIEVGEILSAVFKEHVKPEILPDGRMYFNIADRVLTPTLTKNYDLIVGYSTDVQSQLNAKANIRIKAQVPEMNQDRIDGMINRLSSEADFEKVKWILNEPVVNFSQSIVDDVIKSNASFHSKAGLRVQISRRVSGHKPCDWCKSLAGTYDYVDAPEDIYRGHERCRCTVDYNPGDGRRQDVWSKTWKDPAESAKIEARRNIGMNQIAFEEPSFFTMIEMQDNSDKWYGNLTEQEKDGVYNYTFGEYEKMNSFLRGRTYDSRTSSELEKQIENFSSGLSKFELETNIITYRGVSAKEYKSILNGNVFKDFKSTSTLKEKAKTFAHKQEDEFIVKFKIPKGHHGAFIGTHSVYKKESEFTLNKNAKYTSRITPEGLEVTINE